MEIRTNHNRREIIDASQLTAKEREAYDYIDWRAIDEGRDSASFVRYKGQLYDLGGEVTRTSAFPGWDGYVHWHAFGGVLFRYVTEDHETYVICGTYLT